jgi:hypothetical protein
MNSPRPIGSREKRLLELFVNCRLEMTPQQFYSKWAVSYAQMAQLCRCDTVTVSRWFRRGCNYRPPRHYHKWYLALADIFLESYEDIPNSLILRLCLEL